MVDLITRMTAKYPDDRPDDMLEIISEMEKLAAKYAPVVVGAGPTEEARAAMTQRTVREWQSTLVLVLIAAIIVGTVLVFVLPGGGSEGGPARETPTAEEQAAAALNEAKTYEAQHPEDPQTALEKYKSIIRFFPNTRVVAEAKEAESKIAFKVAAQEATRLGQSNRLYDAVLTFETYVNQYPNAPETKEAEREKSYILVMIKDNYNKDMLEAANLIQEGKTDQARDVLRRILSYCTPELSEKARRDFDRELGSAGSQALRMTHSAAWQAATPMLAAVAAQLVRHDHKQALALSEDFLSSSLPEGVEQILQWERQDVSILHKVIENFEAALGDATGREDSTDFKLADGRNISGKVVAGADGYYLKLGENKTWRISPADLAPANVLKLAGMSTEKPEAELTSMLYELYHGNLSKARALLEQLQSSTESNVLSRYEKKLEIVSAMPLGPDRLSSQPADPLDIRKTAQIVESARNFIAQRNWDQAYSLLKKAVSLNPGEQDVWSLLAKCAAEKDLTAEAIQYYRRALTLNPGNPILWNQLGNLYLKQEENGLALSSFGRSSRMNPVDPAAVLGRIEALHRLGRDAEALKVQKEWEETRQK